MNNNYCIHISMCISYVYIYIYIYTHIHIHTHMHTCVFRSACVFVRRRAASTSRCIWSAPRKRIGRLLPLNGSNYLNYMLNSLSVVIVQNNLRCPAPPREGEAAKTSSMAQKCTSKGV